jgi:NADH dehydrogenase (ubiquinone) 1 beta subcomplex subunit 7
MRAQNLPLRYRDYCAHFITPINKCRRENYFAPWSCHHEKLDWEKCQHQVWKERHLAMRKLRAIPTPADKKTQANGKVWPTWGKDKDEYFVQRLFRSSDNPSFIPMDPNSVGQGNAAAKQEFVPNQFGQGGPGGPGSSHH